MFNEIEWNHKKTELINQLHELKKHSLIYALFRIISAGFMIAGITMSGYYHHAAGNYLLLIALLLFIILVHFHGKCIRNIKECENRLQVIDQMFARQSDGWHQFKEDGSSFIKESDATLLDLDIIGKHSLYQLLCVAKSSLGKQKLYQLFAKGRQSDLEIFQTGIEELSNKQTFLFDFQTELMACLDESAANENHMSELIDEMNQMSQMKGRIFCYLPIVLILTGILVYFKFIPRSLFILLLIVQFSLSCFFSYVNGNQMNLIQRIKLLSENRNNLFRLIEQQNFESTYLKNKIDKMTRLITPSVALKDLDMKLSLLPLRNNPVLYLVFNALFMYDMQCIRLIDGWWQKYGSELNDWIESAAEFEAMISCALLPYARKTTCLPEMTETKEPFVKGETVYHPLIDQNEVVSNSFELKGSNIITGSNMSGKSTFMRCIGVNTILAMAGCRVCASAYQSSLMNVISSMRVHDELALGISTFYAEVLRIRRIMDESNKKMPLLVLIDEIFKGTNSADRIIGASEAIRRLQHPWLLCLVTTHDFELCTISNEIQNYHFSEYYVNDKIYFDYLLKDGRCQTTNAKQLMRMAGIID